MKKFKQGIRPVKGSPGFWDVNYQVDGKRRTKRIQADSFDAALTWRLSQKTILKNSLSGNTSNESIFALNDALEKITEKVRNEIARGSRCSTSLSEIVPPFKRFFFDYPRHTGKTWLTTADMTPDDLENYKNYYSNILKKPMGLSTELRKIKNILSHFYQLKIISLQRLTEFRAVESPKKNVRPFIGNPDEDFIKVLLWIKSKKPRLFEFLDFLSSTGRRPREVRHYRREFVDIENGYINIPSKTKDGEPSKILLDNDLKKTVLKAIDFSRKLNSEYLFLNDGGKQFSANNPQVNFKEAAKSCEIKNWEKWCVYQLKKRFITICRARGLSAEAISQVTGHKDLEAVLRNYSFPDKTQSDKVLQVGRLRV